MPNADRLIELFHEAKARPAGPERERFLAGACAVEPELEAQLVSLLQAHEGAGDFLQPPPLSPTPLVTEKPGDTIGHYKLLQVIGEGGCGVVYMAEQTEPVRRHVALKVIKLGMDTKQVVARFEAERQALALMDHPNIAKILDGGATGHPLPLDGRGAGGEGSAQSEIANLKSQILAGRPYFVMELVRGIKITDYCDQHHLSTRERLELFIQVCQAVQHAHQKGIIHRDIKPSNILVAQHDTVAVPKVIDFGIAKATGNQRLTDKTVFTAFAQFMGTPAYMSPEQAQLSGLDIDTRTDIYSLGVLLYELLTGKTPFDTQELMKVGLDELRRTIRETPPVRPSTRLMMELRARQRVAAGVPPAATSGRLPPKQKELINLLRGDLDWIVMKCLEKDRTRRYETANGLAMDLRRHLNYEPIIARPPSRAYRFKKLIHRHKLVFAGLFLITMALTAGLLGVLWQSAGRQKALAETRLLLYATDMNLAQQAVESMNFGRAVGLLDRHRPVQKSEIRNPKSEIGLRGFEWRYLWGLCQGDEQATLRGHTSTVTGVAFSPDGRLLASCSKDKTVRLWDVASQRLLRVLTDYLGEIYSVAFSLDGRQLVAAGHSGVTFWETRHWTVQRSFAGVFRSAAFTRDGQTIVASAKAGITVLATAQGTGPFLLPDTSGPAVFSPDEQQLATLSRDGIKLWNVSSLSSNASPLRTIPWTNFQHSGEHELAFSPDGQIIAAADNDGRVMLFDPRSGQPLAAFEHSSRIDSLVFSPDGKTLASASADQTVKLWGVAVKMNLATLHGHQNAVRSVAFSPHAQTLATGSSDWTVKLWKVASRSSIDGFQLAGPHSRICADGAIIANWDKVQQHVQFHSVSTKQLTDSFTLPAHSDYWNISPSGQTMAAVSNGSVYVWNIAAKTENVAFQIPPDLQLPPERMSGPLQISPDGSALALDGPDFTVRSWSLPAGREQRSFSGTLLELMDGVLVTARSNHAITFWDCNTGRETLTLKGHQDLVRGIAFSPDRQTVATASWDHTARLWEATTGREIGVLRGHKEGLECIDFSLDGRTLATGSADDTIKLWNVATQQEVFTLRPRHSDILSLRFVPDGSALITLSITGMVKVWRAPLFQDTDAPGSQ